MSDDDLRAGPTQRLGFSEVVQLRPWIVDLMRALGRAARAVSAASRRYDLESLLVLDGFIEDVPSRGRLRQAP